jgi:PadR family transcriptional regulator, regulatory protein PadR
MAGEKEHSSFGNPPKNFLVPFILLLLFRMPMHGYELMQKLASFGFSALDNGNFYRMLRQLEKDEFVRSQWETSTTGPAKRLYSLTEAGEAYLRAYAGQLEQYQAMLEQFFNLYTSMLGMYLPAFPQKGKEKSLETPEERRRDERDEEERRRE